MPAPRRPAGVNAPAKVSACGTTMNAANRYPVASAKSERAREIEYCANSRTAVTRLVTKTIASSAGKRALSAARGLPANGAAAANPTSANAATAYADLLCQTVGLRSTSHVSAPDVSSRAMIRAHAPVYLLRPVPDPVRAVEGFSEQPRPCGRAMLPHAQTALYAGCPPAIEQFGHRSPCVTPCRRRALNRHAL